MVIGLLRARLEMPASHGLKEKRAALAPLLSTLRKEFSAAVAEIDQQDTWQRSDIAVCVVSADRRHANGVLSKVQDRLSDWGGEAVLGSCSTELIDIGTFTPPT